MIENYLYDKEFLKKIDNLKFKIIYARIFSLSKDDQVQEDITGKISSGSITIDGTSASRRTCSLSFVSQQINLTDYFWGLNTKIKLEIGIKNEINNEYPDILWFPQGIYYITSFSSSISDGNLSISIQGNDKMSRLNGELGGYFYSDISLDTIEEKKQLVANNENTIINKKKIPIYNIILNLLTQFGQEDYKNIIIEDLPLFGFELLEYKGDTPLYVILKKSSAGEAVQQKEIKNITLDGDITCKAGEKSYSFKTIPTYDALNELSNLDMATTVTFSNVSGEYTVAKCEYGSVLGYHLTELVYPGELNMSNGDTITTALDKIVKVLGNYEYFYNVNGQFVFRKKKNYIQTSFQALQGTENNITFEGFSPYIYEFTNSSFITSISNTPNFANIKNDFTIWGEREGANDTKIPIHLRYAIDKKPKYYKPIKLTNSDVTLLKKFYPEEASKPEAETIWYKQHKQYETVKTVSYKYYDWREILYRMALDYNRYAMVLPEFNQRVAEANPSYTEGITGYEIYYTDIFSFWREIYNPFPKKSEEEYYYPKIKNNKSQSYWNKKVYENPETLNFWFDFLSAKNCELEKYSIQSIGQRSKIINETSINSIYYRETPNILFYSSKNKEDLNNVQDFKDKGYQLFNLTKELMDTFFLSSQGVDTYSKLNEELNSHTNAAETISISSLPIYYLEPNSTILVVDKEIGINGDYIINSISYSFGPDSTMELQCEKIQATVE